MRDDTPQDGATDTEDPVARLDQLVAARVEGGECGCGCGGSIPVPREGRRARQKFVRDHRQRIYRKRVQRAAEAAGVPARVSLGVLQAPDTTRDRSGYAPAPANTAETRHPPPSRSRRERSGGPRGATLPWRRAVTVLAEHFQAAGYDAGDAQREAVRILAAALSDKQRERLGERA